MIPFSIPGAVVPLSCRDAGGCTSSRGCQPFIRRGRHCLRRDLRAIRFPDPRPTAPGQGLFRRHVVGGFLGPVALIGVFDDVPRH